MTKISEQIELSDEVSRQFQKIGPDNGLELIKSISDVTALARGNQLFLTCSEEKSVFIKRFIDLISKRISETNELEPFEIKRIFNQCKIENLYSSSNNKSLFPELIVSYNGSCIRAKTPTQQRLLDSISSNHITIVRGPAGTGKTFLTTAFAIKTLREKIVNRIILARPVVEAGESLGFLPGDIKEKVDPHFRPLYDSLQEFIGLNKFEQYLRQGIIEITPLAYMRGRTFNHSFVIVDEAQNTTLMQMRMALTRIGHGTKMVITGDCTQIDLPRSSDSSMLVLPNILSEINSIGFVDLTSEDVVRHEIVTNIINAFEKYDRK